VSKLELIGLTKRYGDRVVVDDLDLEIAEGEFVTLLGPSGCGKTTTLRAVAGLVEIDSGEIRFDGRRMNDVPPHKRSTALVFQSYALFPHMNVRENIGFGLRMRHVGKDEMRDRVDEAMAMVGLDAYADRRPGQLSGGQQQRVALARAVVTRPDILLFDEPLSNLDAKLRERLRDEIRDLQRRLGITSLYVTHDQAEALTISDRIAVMADGRIEQLGDPTTIYSQPVTRFTAEFVGQANIFDATLRARSDHGSVEVDTPLGRLLIDGPIEAQGPAVLISWRPEDVVPFLPGMANRLAAVVKARTFMGNLTHLTLEVGGTTVRAERPGTAEWQVGDSVDVAIAPERIRILR
jgi:iron(III) transport system ATP-binding protein